MLQKIEPILIGIGIDQCEWAISGFVYIGKKAKATDGWVHRESNLMLTLSSDKDQRENRFRFRVRLV